MEQRIVLSETNITAAAYDQVSPATAMNASGAYVVAWEDHTSSTPDIYVRSPSSGTPIRVNTTELGYDPAVAIGDSGNFVVTWTAPSNVALDLAGKIVARLYDSAGTALTDPFVVNDVGGVDIDSSVAMDTDGDFVVTWTSEEFATMIGGPNYVYARLFNPDGTAKGSEFRVTNNGDQVHSSVAMDNSGNFVVTWTGENPLVGDEEWDIRARLFDATGSPTTAWFTVNQYTDGGQGLSSVAMDADGDFVVAWASYGQDGSGNGIYARTFTASAVGSTEFLVNTTTALDQTAPSVAMEDNGDFMIAWQCGRSDGLHDIYARLYGPSGAIGGEFVANTTLDGDHVTPAVGMDTDGDYVIVWAASQPDSYGWDIYGLI